MLVQLNKILRPDEVSSSEDLFNSFTEEKLWEPWMEKVSYHLLTSMDEVEEYFDNASKVSSHMGIDLETTGLNVFEDTIVGFSFSYKENDCAYVPIDHTTGLNVPLPAMVDFLNKHKERFKWIFYNAKFDAEVLLTAGVSLESHTHFEDAMLSVCLFDLNKAKTGAGLKAASLNYLGKKMVSYMDALGSKGKETGANFRDVPLDIATVYAGSDALNTLELYHKFPEVRKEQGFIYNMETRLIDVVRRMERNGVAIDVPYFEVLRDRVQFRLDRLKKEIFAACNKEYDSFNIDSGPQVGKVFFEEMGIPNPYRTATGKYNTGAEVLDKLADETGHPVLQLYKKYKKAHKLMSSFITPYLHDKDLKIGYLSFKQFQIATGRFGGGGANPSSHCLPGVNPQNIPSLKPKKDQVVRKIKNDTVSDKHLRYEGMIDCADGLYCTQIECAGCPFIDECDNELLTGMEMDTNHNIRRGFIARDPNKIIFTIDFSGVELRMAANLSKEEAWVDSFINGDGDLHTLSAINIFKKDREDISKSERGLGKTVNFLALYGGGPHGLSEQAKITPEEAKTVLENFWAGVPAVDSLRKQVWADAAELKYVATHFGRRRPAPAFLEKMEDMKTKEERDDLRKRQSATQREAFSLKIQGSAADLMKLAMLRCDSKIKEEGWEEKLRILLTVHDELVFECDKDIANEAMRKMSDCMQVPIKGFEVPFITDIELSDHALSNWGMTTECRVHTDGNIYPTKILKKAAKKSMGVREYLLSIGENVLPVVPGFEDDEGSASSNASVLSDEDVAEEVVSESTVNVESCTALPTLEEFNKKLIISSLKVELTKDEGSELVKYAKALWSEGVSQGIFTAEDSSKVKEIAFKLIYARACEKLFSISLVDNFFEDVKSIYGGLSVAGFDLDIISCELGEFPKVKVGLNRPAILLLREGARTVYFAGLLYPDSISSSVSNELSSGDLEEGFSYFYNLDNLCPVLDGEELKTLGKNNGFYSPPSSAPKIEGVYSSTVTGDSTLTKVRHEDTDNISSYTFDFRGHPMTLKLGNQLNSLLDGCPGISTVYFDFSTKETKLIFKRTHVDLNRFRQQYTLFFG